MGCHHFRFQLLDWHVFLIPLVSGVKGFLTNGGRATGDLIVLPSATVGASDSTWRLIVTLERGEFLFSAGYIGLPRAA